MQDRKFTSGIRGRFPAGPLAWFASLVFVAVSFCLFVSSAWGVNLSAVGNQLWHQDVENVNGNVEAMDHFGSALARGDFNGDGYQDLAVGVPSESVGGTSQAGAVNVLYGTADAAFDEDRIARLEAKLERAGAEAELKAISGAGSELFDERAMGFSSSAMKVALEELLDFVETRAGR